MPDTPETYPDWSLLATWVTVVESGSVSATSQRLDISQAAVSQRLKLLESTVGAELMDRSTRPAQPTAVGLWLFEQANRLLSQAAEMAEGVRNFSHAKRHVVRFGCVDSFAGTLGPTLIRGLSGESRQILLWSGLTPLLDEQMENRKLDMAVTTSGVAHRPSVKKQPLFSEPYLLVLPRDFEASGLHSLTDLARRLKFIRYSARSVIGSDVDRYLDAAGEKMERTYEFDNTDPMLSLVSEGMGFALSTPLCIWQSRHFLEQLRILPLAALPGTQARSRLPWRRTFYLSYRENEFGKLPGEARNVIGIGVGKLFQKEIGPALKLPVETLWQTAGRPPRGIIS
ncbi:Ben and cat operon transcriptional regulator [Bordetella sputigena]